MLFGATKTAQSSDNLQTFIFRNFFCNTKQPSSCLAQTVDATLPDLASADPTALVATRALATLALTLLKRGDLIS
ncbi:hypothetical protein HBI56_030010 [Parastagonospora nodorum]|nr:hypothetical protein HBH56_017620 [Parastagonospora nodorum]KAH3937084.1 hypothetical protein HBH54_016860 [Parastagonospora nodorum]KAH3953608.1 hypothetical protein HBH53_028960 [Parastagonospora nodorum]KAH3962567.1 hypothetical protein HBH51_172770 [Parastagonospora nodorum]KAH3990728.1 hypothetical protein HBH52_005760 [Parastagonospora nodorum]